MKDALGHGSDPHGGAAHQEGVREVGKPAKPPSKWAQNQMLGVQNLQIPPRENTTLTKFETEEVGRYVLVHRAYSPNHAPSLSYTEGFQVGPHGRVKKMYETKNW